MIKSLLIKIAGNEGTYETNFDTEEIYFAKEETIKVPLDINLQVFKVMNLLLHLKMKILELMMKVLIYIVESKKSNYTLTKIN